MTQYVKILDAIEAFPELPRGKLAKQLGITAGRLSGSLHKIGTNFESERSAAVARLKARHRRLEIERNADPQNTIPKQHGRG